MVGAGVNVGVFDHWMDASLQVTGVPHSAHKKYSNMAGALDYYREYGHREPPKLYLRANGWSLPAGYQQGDKLPSPGPTGAGAAGAAVVKIEGLATAAHAGVTAMKEEAKTQEEVVERVTWGLQASVLGHPVPPTDAVDALLREVAEDCAAAAGKTELRGNDGPEVKILGYGSDSEDDDRPPPLINLEAMSPVQRVEFQALIARANREAALARIVADGKAAEAEEAAALDEARAAEAREAARTHSAAALSEQGAAESSAWAQDDDEDFCGMLNGLNDVGSVPDVPGGENRPFRETDPDEWNRVLTAIAGAVRRGFYPAAVQALGEHATFKRSALKAAVEVDFRMSRLYLRQEAVRAAGRAAYVDDRMGFPDQA